MTLYMRFKRQLLLLLCLCGCFSSCHGQNGQTIDREAEPIQIHRFDKLLLHWLEQGDSAAYRDLQQQNRPMLEVLGKSLFNLPNMEAAGFEDKLRNYYAEPTLHQLYVESVAHFETVAELQQQLGRGFHYLLSCFPDRQMPTLYMHVSGLNQNVLVTDELLSLSIDKYLGKDYPLYQEFFYPYQTEKMQRDNVAPDYLTGWLMAEFPFEGKENVLLDRMVYEGKLLYLLAQALPEMRPERLLGYTPEQLAWVQANEKKLWQTIIERKHLYTPDLSTTNRYFEEAPSLFMATDAPGCLGKWIGWQLVTRFMQETGTTPAQLMQLNDAQSLLTQAKYKP